MSRFIEGEQRTQSVLFPEQLEDWITEDNPVRAVDAFVDELDLTGLGFAGAQPAATGRPVYHPATLLKIYIYGYLNRVQSSRRLEREAQRNVELIWLTGCLMPDFKTIADFRRDNGPGIRQVCRQFVQLCREIGLFEQALVAIDGSKFKAVNNRDKNFTPHKLKARQQQLDQSIARYLSELDRADRDPSLVPEARVEHLKEKTATVREQMKKLQAVGRQLKLADAASALHLPPHTLARRLAAEGIEFRELANAVRMQRAANMLAASDATVGEVAARLGYTHASNFISAFRARQGISPRKYRQSLKNR